MRYFKRSTGRLIPFALVILMVLFSCGTKRDLRDPTKQPGGEIEEGSGTFTYNDYAPLKDKPLTIWYHRPAGNVENLPIMILMHGNSRAAKSYRDRMAPHADKHGFVLIVPEFSTDIFPGSRTYHQGNVLTSGRDPIDEEKWTFSVIEPIFDYVKADIGSKRESYLLYGFSAGSQFVHRFNWHKPDNRAEKIVAGAAGYYSMPDFGPRYPYGLDGTVVTEAMVKKALSNKVIVLVGGNDNNRGDSNLIKNDRADAQGQHRVERAESFYAVCKAKAASMGIPFDWEYGVVPNVGHSQGGMAGPVADYLFGKSAAK